MSEQKQIGRVSFADSKDIDLFVATLEKYERGELDADGWRKFRLLNGVYGQRQADAQMLRIKAPQGILEAAQLIRLAEVAERFASGRGHVTTRQNIQMYDLKLEEAEGAMRSLEAVGLTTKEACGSSIRNVTASPLAGVDPDEPFDVTPYAEGLTRYFLRGPISSSLPRKFKIAFEGSPRDFVRGPINDICFLAVRTKDGAHAFRVLAGGGTATLSRTGGLLAAELPAKEILGIAEAIVRVFHREGDYTNRAKARMKWLIKKIGWDEFEKRVHMEWDRIRAEGGVEWPVLVPPPLFTPKAAEAPVPVDANFSHWRRTNVIAQKQAGLYACSITLPLGDVSPTQFRALAELCARFSDGTVRTSIDQNLYVRHVPEGSLTAFYKALVEIGYPRSGAGSLADVTSCAGAHTCALAVTASRGLGDLLGEHLKDSAAARGEDPGLDGANIRISGCPNGCGQHHVASVGFQGGMRKVGGRPLPLYQITIGGGVPTLDSTGPSVAKFGRLVGKVPAHRSAQALDRILGAWRTGRTNGESLDQFLARVPLESIKLAIGELFDINEATARPSDYVDLGQDVPFTVQAQEDEDHLC